MRLKGALAYIFMFAAMLFFMVAMCSTVENPLIAVELPNMDNLLETSTVDFVGNVIVLFGLNIFAIIAWLLVANLIYPKADSIFSSWWHPPKDKYTIDVEPGNMVVFVGRQTFKPTTLVFMVPWVLTAFTINLIVGLYLFFVLSSNVPGLLAASLAGATSALTSVWLVGVYLLKDFLRRNHITLCTLTRVYNAKIELALLGLIFGRRAARPIISTTPIEEELEVFRASNPGDLSEVTIGWPMSSLLPLLGSDNFLLINRESKAQDLLLHLERGEFFADVIDRLKSEQVELKEERETTQRAKIQLRYGIHELVRDEADEWSPERGLAAEEQLLQRQQQVREHMRPGSSERIEVYIFDAQDPGFTLDQIFNPAILQERGGVADFFRAGRS